MYALRRSALIATLCLIAASFCAFASAASAAATPPVLSVEALGKGSAPLDGPWQFHLGDDPAFAAPALDDATGVSGWEQITTDQTWGAQSHRAYVGYAWYRRHLHVSPAPGTPGEVHMMVEHVDDIYEVYWNGIQVGHSGTMPPRPSFRYTQGPQLFNLGAARDGVLAVRVWKQPLESFGSGLEGGFRATPVIGSPAAIADRKTASDYRWLHSRQYTFGLQSLYGLVALLGIIAWLRNRSQTLPLFIALYSGSWVIGFFLTGLRLPFSYYFALGSLQPVHGVTDVALWFLLIGLFGLNQNRGLVRLAIIFAWIDMVANVLDGLLVLVPSSVATSFWQGTDAFLTVFETLPEVLPLIIIYYGIRKKNLDLSQVLVAISAAIVTFIFDLRIALSQGSRFTHWTLAQKINEPLFTINGNVFTVFILANTALLLSIVYAVYCNLRDTAQRQGALEQELRSAQELQQVLIPEQLPALPGYAVTSAYRPAQEVGGDFFQVIPGKDASLVVVGDVSGKGLRAAMTVSLIIGTLRTLAEFSDSPAEVLSGLNRRLHNRLHGGFATCIILRMDADGACVIANAGHPAPWVNDRELELPGALPLGLLPNSRYEEVTLQLAVADHLLVYTDGLLEARTAYGEIFSFDRLRALAAKRPSAEQATAVAQDFGQDDDITVVTLTRLAAGEQSTTVLTAPSLATPRAAVLATA